MTKGDDKGGGQGRPSQGSARNRPGGNLGAAGQNQSNKAQGWGCVTLLIALVAGGILWGMYDEGVFDKKAEEDAPVFGPKAVGRLVEQLSTAADAQGVCYGWVIDSGRNQEIKKLTPSYPGTFRPHSPKQAPGNATPSPAVQAGAGSGSGASPAPRPSSTGARPPASAATPTPAPTREGHFSDQFEIEYDLKRLDERGVEFGSNLGPGKDPRQVPGQCPEWVVLRADYIYSESYDEYQSGRLEIKSSFDQRFGAYERRLGQSGEDDIDGEWGTARLRDAIGGLPMLVAAEGLAPQVPAETEQAAAPSSDDELYESTVNKRNVWSVIGILLIGSAVVVIVIGAVRRLRSRGS